MHKMLSNSVFFLSPSVHERGFGVAAFDFETAKPAIDKKPGLPANFPLRAPLHGKKS
jgi:hypothetical protein